MCTLYFAKLSTDNLNKEKMDEFDISFAVCFVLCQIISLLLLQVAFALLPIAVLEERCKRWFLLISVLSFKAQKGHSRLSLLVLKSFVVFLTLE